VVCGLFAEECIITALEEAALCCCCMITLLGAPFGKEGLAWLLPPRMLPSRFPWLFPLCMALPWLFPWLRTGVLGVLWSGLYMERGALGA